MSSRTKAQSAEDAGSISQQFDFLKWIPDRATLVRDDNNEECHQSPAHPDAGFSLLEVIVALAVFSLGALALLNVIGESTRSQQANQTRAIARIVAENQLVEVMALREAPQQGAQSGTEQAMNRTWKWERTIAPTEEPRILRIDVRVREQGQPQTLAEFSSFRAAQ